MATYGITPTQPTSIAVQSVAACLIRDVSHSAVGDAIADPVVIASQARLLRTLFITFRAHFPATARRASRELGWLDRTIAQRGTAALSAPRAIRLQSRLAVIASSMANSVAPTVTTTEASIRRAARNAIARQLRKMLRRAKRFERGTPARALLPLIAPLERIRDLAWMFEEIAAPGINAFRRRADDLADALTVALSLAEDAAARDRTARDKTAQHTAATEAAEQARVRALDTWKRFRKRRIRRLAVPDL